MCIQSGWPERCARLALPTLPRHCADASTGLPNSRTAKSALPQARAALPRAYSTSRAPPTTVCAFRARYACYSAPGSLTRLSPYRETATSGGPL